MVGDLFDILGDDGAVVLRVVAHPGAGRTAVVGQHGDALKVKVAAPPVDGRANDACAALVAEVLGVEPARVTLVGGRSSRSKRFRVDGVAPDDARRLLGEALDRAASRPGTRARGGAGGTGGGRRR